MNGKNQETNGKNQANGDEAPIDSVPLYGKKRIMIPLLSVLAVVLVVIVAVYLNSREYLSTDDAYVDGDKVTVSSKYVGRISKINVDEGDTVKKGQVLVELDNSDLSAQREQAQASMLYAQQNVKLAEINLSKADDDFKRAEVQYKSNIIPKEQYDHAQKALESAQAQSSLAEAQLATSKAQTGVIDTQLHNIIIASPMDGVVSKRWAMVGDVVQMAQPVLTVYDLDNLWVTANFEETKYSEIRLGEKVQIYVDAYRGKKFEGKVVSLGSNTASEFSLIPPNNAAGNFTKVTQRIPVKISIDGISANSTADKYPLLPGMSLEVKVSIK